MNARLLLWGLLLFGGISLNAQNGNSSDLLELEVEGWYRYTGSEKLNAQAFLQRYHQTLGLSSVDQLSLQRTSHGLDGSTHLHYQQLHQGIPIEAGELILHLRDNAVYMANGEIIKGFQSQISTQLDENEAFRKALEYFPSDLYRWEAEGKMRPQGSLIFADDQFTKNPQAYSLCWKFDIHSALPEDRNWVYINANNGELDLALSRIHTHDTGTAVTRYSGTRTIYTSFDPSLGKYVLRDSLSGGGIYTFNMENRTNKATAVDFEDDDNYWNNFNAQFNEVAGDAHWGAERVYSYFKNRYNYLSYDNQDSPLLSYVHFDSSFVNAFWNGQEMTYGDGNGTATTPLVSLDVVAHEIAHGITEYTANLIYQGEAGALNESFSDIFGAALEFEFDSAGGDWKIGEDFLNTGNGIRNMRNPSLFNHPDTYLGTDWGFGLFFDNGWVHFNSGVQNYWYYLLSDGDSGINDNNQGYDVEGIGFEKATDISFQNLDNYLTRFSDHHDARMGAIQSAIDLYGTCSNEYIQTRNAWYAAGVGEPTGTIDLSIDDILLPERDCSFSSSEIVNIGIRNNSCSQSIPAGATINIDYSINNGTVHSSSLNLTSALGAGNVIYFQHPQSADLSAVGAYDILATISYSADSLDYNNSLEKRVRQMTYQNADWNLVEIISPVSGCELDANTLFEVSAVFLGCDSLAMGTSIDLDFTNLGNSQSSNTSLGTTVHYGDTIVLSFPSNVDLSARGANSFNFTLNFSGDPSQANNRIFNHRVLKPYELLGGKIGFEDFAYIDSLVVRQGPNNGNRRNSVASVGNRGLEIVGGPLVNYPDPFEVPRNDTVVWDVNPDFRSTFCTCVDASNETNLHLSFDLKQAYNRLIRRLRSEPSNSPHTSSLRILADGQQISPTFTPLTLSSDTFRTHLVDLNNFAGRYFELCFETHLMVDARTNNVTGDGDIINLDNIFLSNIDVGLNEEGRSQTVALKLYPNPNKGNFKLNLKDADAGTYRLWLQDVQGRILLRRNIETQTGAQTWEFDTKLSVGTYFLMVQMPNGDVQNVRMLVQ